HPALDEGEDDGAEVAGGADPPVVEDGAGHEAPPLEGEIPAPLRELPAADVAGLAEALDGVVETGQDEQVRRLVIARIPLAKAVHHAVGKENPAHPGYLLMGRRPRADGRRTKARPSWRDRGLDRPRTSHNLGWAPEGVKRGIAWSRRAPPARRPPRSAPGGAPGGGGGRRAEG